MDTVDARGTKRTCQNDDCGSRFYDLNRNPIVCPICETVYALAHAPAGAVTPEETKAKEVKRRPNPDTDDKDKDTEDGELADIEADDAIPDDDDEDDTFLEDEEEDEGTVTTIIPGIAEDKEES